jgi:hypothetical protein
MKITHLTAAALAGASLLFSACGGGEDKSSAGPLPEAPDAAIEAISLRLGEGDAGVLWEALPESYRGDLTEIIHEAGNVVDAELYDRGFGLVGRLADVAEKQRDFILNSPFAQNVDVENAKANWQPVVQLLRLVGTSELSTAAGLQSLDPQAFLDGTASEVLDLVDELSALSGEESPLAQFAALQAEVVEGGADTATLTMTVPGQPAETESFTKIEGKWVPTEMASQWASSMEEARAQLKKAAEGAGAQNKPQILGVLGMMEGVLTQLETAETQEQFDQALQGAMMPMMGLMMLGNSLGGGGAPAPAMPPMPAPDPAAPVE